MGQTRSPYSTEGDERQFAKCVATRGLKRCDTSEPRCQLLEALPWDSAPRYLLRDRDACYGKEFHEARGWLGIRDVLTAPRSPWQNPYVERLIGTIRRECLDHVIVLNETGLRRVLKLHFEYYERTRTHLSLDKDAAIPRRVHPPELGKVVKLPEFGGLHHRYERRAA